MAWYEDIPLPCSLYFLWKYTSKINNYVRHYLGQIQNDVRWVSELNICTPPLKLMVQTCNYITSEFVCQNVFCELNYNYVTSKITSYMVFENVM